MARESSYDEVREALTRQHAVLVQALARLDPAGPTDCAGWTVADLESHLAQNVRGLAAVAERRVDQAADGGGVEQWSTQLERLAEVADAHAHAERLRLDDYTQAADLALAEYPADTVVQQLTGRHTLKDAAVFRVVEGVVHGLDTGIEPDPLALRLVVRELARAFAARYPGKTVELRIPPYSAVQCLEGPRHTRGTPPNVVEAQPVAWVRVAAGREAWEDLVRTGRITASGERSDLSSLLPLLA
jgi:uncharacterized protein (TIGR03083 family)